MKKAFAWILAAVLMVGMVSVPVQAQENPFTDVQKSHFFYEAVLWAVDEGIVEGMTATSFEPYTVCNRAQVVTFLWRAAGSPGVNATTSPFSDVKMGKWYTTPVLWAVENGIAEGMGDGTFGITRPCNRAQAVTFLWRAAGKPAPATKNHGFTDVPVGKWYEAPVLWAVENEITTGATATTFNPNGNCQRAQVVTFLYRMKHPAEKAAVVDAYSDTVYDSDWDETFCYHIPKLVLSRDKAGNFNKTVYDKLYGMLRSEVYEAEYYPEISHMLYTWGQKKDVVSIVVATDFIDYAGEDYYFFYASVEDGKETTAQAVLDEYGLSQQEFYQVAKATLKAYWDGRKDIIDFVGQKEYNRLVAETLADSNVKLSQPYINTNGELCIVANVYSPAGADSYWNMLNTVTGTEEPYLECNIHN